MTDNKIVDENSEIDVSSLQWIVDIREELFEMESANIKSRVRKWISLVNIKLSHFCQKLATNNNGSVCPMNSIPAFTSDLALKVGEYLKFIRNWAGINVKITARKPKTYQQYRTRAINWLNGRRPRIYDCNLFPDMLLRTKQFVMSLNFHTFLNLKQNVMVRQSLVTNTLRKCLMLGIMQEFCAATVKLDTRRGNFDVTHLVCKDIFKLRKSQTIPILKQFYFSMATSYTSSAMYDSDEFSDIFSTNCNKFPSESCESMEKAFQRMYDRKLSVIHAKYIELGSNNNMSSGNNSRGSGNVSEALVSITAEELVTSKKQVEKLKQAINMLISVVSGMRMQPQTFAVIANDQNSFFNHTLHDLKQKVNSLEQMSIFNRNDRTRQRRQRRPQLFSNVNRVQPVPISVPTDDYSFNHSINEHSSSSSVTPTVNMQHNSGVDAPLYSTFQHGLQFHSGLLNAHQTLNNFQYSSSMNSKVNEQFVCNHEFVVSSVNNCVQRNVTSNFEAAHHSMNANVNNANDHQQTYFNDIQSIFDENSDNVSSIAFMMNDYLPTEDYDMNTYF